MLELIALLTCSAIAYHHAAYPLLLRALARKTAPEPALQLPMDAGQPDVTILVPAYQEARRIREKIRNLAALDYPHDKIKIIIACDGCTDSTAQNARDEVSALTASDIATSRLNIQIVEHQDNRGKVAVLNEAIAAARSQIVVLTDVSSRVAPGALARLVRWFADPEVAIACGKYKLPAGAQAGEHAYWAYQNALKELEAASAAPMGVNGAFYGLRRSLWSPLPADAINDDFILPMRMVAAGGKIALDSSIEIEELEASSRVQDLRRRVRLGAGNLQQIFMCQQLAEPFAPKARLCVRFRQGAARAGAFCACICAALQRCAGVAGKDDWLCVAGPASAWLRAGACWRLCAKQSLCGFHACGGRLRRVWLWRNFVAAGRQNFLGAHRSAGCALRLPLSIFCKAHARYLRCALCAGGDGDPVHPDSARHQARFTRADLLSPDARGRAHAALYKTFLPHQVSHHAHRRRNQNRSRMVERARSPYYACGSLHAQNAN